MTIKHLYVNGDSFAFGQGLDPEEVTAENIYTFSENKQKFTYSGIIKEKLNIPLYTNNALPGGSNDLTFRTSMHDLLELKKTTDPKDILVMMALTEASRMEMFNINNNGWAPFLAHCEPRRNDSANHRMWQLYYSYFSNVKENQSRLFVGLLGMQHFLKHHGFNYVITESIHMFEDRSLFGNHPMYAELDLDRYYHLSFNGWARQKKFEFSKCSHPRQDAHAAWADVLLNFMESKNIC